MVIKLGIGAPDFSLSDQHGKIHRLHDERGRWVLLYFYPKDMTPGCTTEACTIRDEWPQFERKDITVLGVSTDTVASHAKFAEAHDLPFPLLADTEKKVVELYGVWGKKKFMGREYFGTKRMSFLIDPKGKVAKIYETVKPRGHAAEVLQDVEAFGDQ